MILMFSLGFLVGWAVTALSADEDCRDGDCPAPKRLGL